MEVRSSVIKGTRIWELLTDGKWAKLFLIGVAISIVVPILIGYFLRSSEYLLCLFLPVVTTMCRVKSKAEEFMKYIGPRVEEFVQLKRELGNADEEKLKDSIESCEKKLAKKEEQYRLLDGKNLRDFLSMNKQAGYESKLNIVHQVQKDLNQLCEALKSRKQERSFPRGKPRIVLFIDDLDRN